MQEASSIRSNVVQMPTLGQQNRLKKQLTPQKPLDKWIKDLAKALYENQKWGEIQRVQWAVTMRRRFRGTSMSDRCGVFFPIASQSTGWCDVYAGLHTLNIIKPTVRANEATMVEARIAVQIKPGTSEGKIEGAAGVAQGVYDFLDNRDWDERLEGQLNQSIQLSGSEFILSRKNPNKLSEKLKRPVYGKIPIPVPGEFSCGCGAGGHFDGEITPDDLGHGTTPCPKCGNAAMVTQPPGVEEFEGPVNEEEFQVADSDTKLVSMFEIRMDEMHTQGGNIDAAWWFERHYGEYRCSVEAKYPHIDFGQPKPLSYSLKWELALRNGAQGVDYFNADRRENPDLDIFEIREIYLRPELYRHRVEPSDFKLLGPNDEILFEVKAGDKLIETAPDGICFRICDEHLLYVYNKKPDYKNDDGEFYSCDFRDEYQMVQFLPDADAPWSLGIVELEPIQQDVNNNRTIDQTSLEKNAQTNLLYDSLHFDSGAFDTDLVPTRAGITRDRPLKDYVAQLDAPMLGDGVMKSTAVLMSWADKIGGVQPAMVGASQPGQPYAAQLQQKQQSQGLLAPSQQSKAQAKKGWAKQQLKIAQGWPEERFEYIKSKFGEEWKDQDIKAFLECDIDRDLDIEHIEGSEIPRGLIEREMQLKEFMSNAIAMAAIPGWVPEGTGTEIFAKMAEYADLSVDIGNAEGNQRLAQRRYHLMVEKCAEAQQSGQHLQINRMDGDQMAQLQQVSQMTGQPMPVDPLVKSILADPAFFVAPGESFKLQVEFFTDHLKALQAEDFVDVLLINVILTQIDRQQAGEVQAGQQVTSSQVLVQKPALEAQAAFQQEQAGKQQQQEAQSGADQSAQDHSQTMEQQGAQTSADQANQVHESRQGALQALDAHAAREHEQAMADKNQSHERLKMAGELAKLQLQAKNQKGKANAR